jgi:thiamine-phosphate pyrophosphorylase
MPSGTSIRLCLAIEASGPEAVARLEAALAGRSVASLVIVPPGGGGIARDLARQLMTQGQAHGAAVLLEGDARLARSLAADGVHLPRSEDPMSAYASARAVLGPRLIVGAEAGQSRHDAMCLGEAGADFISFGLAGGGEAADEARRELIGWWAELFEVPVVAADVETAEEAARLVAAGADFIAVTIPEAVSASEISRRLDAIERALSRSATAECGLS